jgi:hypothetical protein
MAGGIQKYTCSLLGVKHIFVLGSDVKKKINLYFWSPKWKPYGA